MAFPKTEIYSQENQQLSKYGKAMCHPARVFIMLQILAHHEMCVNEIEGIVPLSQPAVSDHLNTLRKTGLIEVECRGRYNYYRLNLDKLAEAADQFHGYFQQLIRDALQLAEKSESHLQSSCFELDAET